MPALVRVARLAGSFIAINACLRNSLSIIRLNKSSTESHSQTVVLKRALLFANFFKPLL